MDYTKTKINKSVSTINNGSSDASLLIEANTVFDYWRKLHIEPLTEITLKLQEWFLSEYGKEIYVAQRLKRKPQILRKLKRFSTRLTQLQDIGGCRVIVEKNTDVDTILEIIENKNKKSRYFEILHTTDYRQKGRDDSGYRAMHVIVRRKNVLIEIQIRSKIQHYWAESIERTSVVSGKFLKELQGPENVLEYFRSLSNILFDIENGVKIKKEHSRQINKERLDAEKTIKSLDSYKVLDSQVNEQFIQSMIGKEKTLRKSPINNWMIVFDWKRGEFLYWVHLDKNPNTAIKLYADYEKKWLESEGYEVVLISSSSVFTIQETHSHYFGLEHFEHVLDTLDEAKFRLRSVRKLDSDTIHVLDKFYSHRFIGNRRASLDTIKNHVCNSISEIEKKLTLLIEKEYLTKEHGKELYSLNKSKISEIEELIA